VRPRLGAGDRHPLLLEAGLLLQHVQNGLGAVDLGVAHLAVLDVGQPGAGLRKSGCDRRSKLAELLVRERGLAGVAQLDRREERGGRSVPESLTAVRVALLVTASLLPVEVYELTHHVSPFKVVALVINIAVVAYLLFAKRLFGLRGGTAAEEELKARDVGWGALERSAPNFTP
jgi:hypothetical protein